MSELQSTEFKVQVNCAGEMFIEGKRMRENEVHEPTISTHAVPYANLPGIAVNITCSVCNQHLSTYFYAGVESDAAVSLYKQQYKEAFCKCCGARLVEDVMGGDSLLRQHFVSVPFIPVEKKKNDKK